MDASNLLKPALARGELHCVGATTLDEYRKHVEKDAALARRFQPVFVSEPTVEDTISILRGLKEKYEVHHGVRITDSALVAAATLSNRYITDRFLPDKAIDLMDEAASRLRMQVDSKPEALDELDRRIIQLKIEREALKKETDDGLARTGSPGWRRSSPTSRSRPALTPRWQAEKEKLGAAAEAQGAARPGPLRAREGAAPRRPRQGRRARLRRHPGAGEASCSEAEERRPGAAAMVEEAVTPEHIAAGRLALDRHSGRQDAGRRARQAPAHGGRARASASSARARRCRRSRPRCAAPAPACRTRTGRSARSCSWARPASARPS